MGSRGYTLFILITLFVGYFSWWFYVPLPEYAREDRWLFEEYRLVNALTSIGVCLSYEQNL